MGCTELYRNVPKSVQNVQRLDVPKRVPKCTETYRNVPMPDLFDVPKRTERVYKPFGFRYKNRVGTDRYGRRSVCGALVGWVGLWLGKVFLIICFILIGFNND